MKETALIAFATIFATVGPVDVAAIFAGMTPRASARQRRVIAFKGVAIATVLLLVMALFGNDALRFLGISLAALRTAGGILLLLIAVDMVFARHSGGTSTTEEEAREAEGRQDISVFPLATPLIAGPGAMGAVILLMAETQGDLMREGVVIAVLVGVMLITLALLMVAAQVHRLLGVTGLNVITRVVGVLLAALAVQFMFDGIKASGLLG